MDVGRWINGTLQSLNLGHCTLVLFSIENRFYNVRLIERTHSNENNISLKIFYTFYTKVFFTFIEKITA